MIFIVLVLGTAFKILNFLGVHAEKQKKDSTLDEIKTIMRW